MAEEDEIVRWIQTLVGRMMPKSFAATPPAQINVGHFSAGRGAGTIKGDTVDLIAHPAQTINSGDVVVGVPIGPKLYYVVGKT